MPARHRLLLVAAQRTRAVPAELRAAPPAGAAPIRLAARFSPPSSVERLTQARCQRAVAAARRVLEKRRQLVAL